MDSGGHRFGLRKPREKCRRSVIQWLSVIARGELELGLAESGIFRKLRNHYWPFIGANVSIFKVQMMQDLISKSPIRIWLPIVLWL